MAALALQEEEEVEEVEEWEEVEEVGVGVSVVQLLSGDTARSRRTASVSDRPADRPGRGV